jgi:hypothetical protein
LNIFSGKLAKEKTKTPKTEEKTKREVANIRRVVSQTKEWSLSLLVEPPTQ